MSEWALPERESPTIMPDLANLAIVKEVLHDKDVLLERFAGGRVSDRNLVHTIDFCKERRNLIFQGCVAHSAPTVMLSDAYVAIPLTKSVVCNPTDLVKQCARDVSEVMGRKVEESHHFNARQLLEKQPAVCGTVSLIMHAALDCFFASASS